MDNLLKCLLNIIWVQCKNEYFLISCSNRKINITETPQIRSDEKSVENNKNFKTKHNIRFNVIEYVDIMFLTTTLFKIL